MNIFINTQTARELGLPGRHLVGAEYVLPMGKLCSILRFNPLEERFLRAHPFPLTLVATEREGYYRIHVKPAEGATSVPLALATSDVANNPFANSAAFHDLAAALNDPRASVSSLSSTPAAAHGFATLGSGPEPTFTGLTVANAFMDTTALNASSVTTAGSDSNHSIAETTRSRGNNGVHAKSRKRAAPMNPGASESAPQHVMHTDSSSPTTNSSTISALSSSSSGSTASAATVSTSSSSATASSSSSSSSSPSALDARSSSSGPAAKVRKLGGVLALKSEDSEEEDEDESDDDDGKVHDADGDADSAAVDDGDVVQRKKALKKMYKQRYQQKKSIKRKLKRFHETTSDCAVVIFVTRNSQRKFGCDIEFFSPAQESGHFFNLWWAEHQQTLYSYIQAYYQSPNGNMAAHPTPAQEVSETVEAANAVNTAQVLEAAQSAAAAAALAHPYLLHQQHAAHLMAMHPLHAGTPYHSTPFPMSHAGHQSTAAGSATARPMAMQSYLQSASAPLSAYHSPHQTLSSLQSTAANSNLRSSASYPTTALNSPLQYSNSVFFPAATQPASASKAAATGNLPSSSSATSSVSAPASARRVS